MKNIHVKLDSADYPIIIGTGEVFQKTIKELITPILSGKDIFLISDTNVSPLYEQQTKNLLNELNAKKLSTQNMFAGEAHKTLETLESFYHEAASQHLDRHSVVAALGGGVVGDTAGFFAATWLRGIRFLQIPTSLLAMVDSSVGGKVAVDLKEAKNMIGAFHQPIAVIADLSFLETLPEREWKCGFAEIIKYSIILDEEFFVFLNNNIDKLVQHDITTLELVIAKCCELKRFIVEQDEKELGLREILNYGHTFGHALETLYGYELLNHGEGVAIGMMIAANLAKLLGHISEEILQKQNLLIQKLLNIQEIIQYLPPLSSEQILDTMLLDKKTRQQKLRLILPTKIGHCQIMTDFNNDLIKQSIANVLNQIN